MKNLLTIILITLLALFFIGQDLFAIPAFARKYKISCQTCHSPMPRLKAFGDDFAGNAFRLPDQDAPRFFVDTGDDQLSLMRDFPLAVRLEAYATYKTNDKDQGDLKTPWILKLLSAGEITKDVAYYFYFYLSEYGKVAGVEDAYIMFNNLFGSELDIYAGQFQVSDPLFKRELRLTREDYQIYKAHPAGSNINLAYDRGFMFTYGFDTGTDFSFEVVNGNGLSIPDENKVFDKDNFKNLAGRFSQDIGDFLRFGYFGYYGKESIFDDSKKIANNKMYYMGPDLTLSYNDKLELNVQYLYRKDEFASTKETKEIRTNGGLAELIFTPNGDESKWYLVGLFNLVESDEKAMDYKSASIHAGHVFRRNLRFVVEYKYDIKHEYHEFGVGVVSAF